MKSLHVLDVLESDGGWLTAEGVAARTGASDDATKRTLYRLRNDGKVETRLMDGRNEWRYVDGAIPAVDEEEEIPMEKQCSSCRETKPTRDFGKHRSNKDGLAYYCKDCMRQKNRERNAAKKASKAEAAAPISRPEVKLNGWRDTFTNPTLDQLEKLRDLVGVSTLDEAAAISKAIATNKGASA